MCLNLCQVSVKNILCDVNSLVNSLGLCSVTEALREVLLEAGVPVETIDRQLKPSQIATHGVADVGQTCCCRTGRCDANELGSGGRRARETVDGLCCKLLEA